MSEDRLAIVSSDGHAGAGAMADYKGYLEGKHLTAFRRPVE